MNPMSIINCVSAKVFFDLIFKLIENRYKFNTSDQVRQLLLAA